MRAASLGLLLIFLVAAPVRADTPEQRASALSGLYDDHAGQALAKLAQMSPLDRFETLRVLDRSNDTTVRRLYDKLDAAGRAQLLDLVQSSGAAGKAAGEMQLGVVSDVDDTAVPTQYTPDGTYSFKGSGDFYRLLSRGTDGQGDPGNLHFVSARLPALYGNTKTRLEAAGVPVGTFDGDASFMRFAFGGMDGIQQSKIENLDLWLKLHPYQRFVFLGDSLQRDPESYRWVIKNHPDQVEAVLIHDAGGPDRKPSDFQGETFFKDYAQATQIVEDRGIPQPGARLPSQGEDASALPPPETNQDSLTKAEKGQSFFSKIGDFFKENIGSIFKAHNATDDKGADDARAADAPSRTVGMSKALEQQIQRAVDPAGSADDR